MATPESTPPVESVIVPVAELAVPVGTIILKLEASTTLVIVKIPS